MPEIDANTLCTVQLRAAQWELVLKFIGKGPYEDVNLLIQSIVTQVMANFNPPPTPEPALEPEQPGEAP